MELGLEPDQHQKARTELADGIDPSLSQRMARQAAAGADSFEAVAREWDPKQMPPPQWPGASC